VDRSAEKENGVSVFLFLGVWVVPFVALLRFCIRAAVLRLTYVAPRLALQLAHDPTMLVLSYGSMPASTSMTWSACVEGFRLHQWHTGSSWMTWARSSFHRLVP
jgi:hypothetical protein